MTEHITLAELVCNKLSLPQPVCPCASLDLLAVLHLMLAVNVTYDQPFPP